MPDTENAKDYLKLPPTTYSVFTLKNVTWRTYLISFAVQYCFLFRFVCIELVSLNWFFQIWVSIYVYGTMFNWSPSIKELMQTYIVKVSGSILKISTVHLNGMMLSIETCIRRTPCINPGFTVHSLSVWSPACVIIPSKNQNRLLPVHFVWLGADFDVTRPRKVRRFALQARGRPSWFQMYRVKPGDECQIHLGAPSLKSYLLEYVSPFKYSIYSFQSCVHCATNTTASNFGAHIFIVLVVKEKFGLFSHN